MPADTSSHRDKKLLYHLTQVDNLPSIIRHGLLSRAYLAARSLSYSNVANPEILEGRSHYGLDVYVPFHFITRNPFDYAVVRNHPNARFCILAVRRVFAAQNNWLIIPRHPLAEGSSPEVLSWEDGFNRIEWNQLDREDRNFDTDDSCKKACMAEALSPTAIAFSDISFIFVPTETTAEIVRGYIGDRSSPSVTLNSNMFPRDSI